MTRADLKAWIGPDGRLVREPTQEELRQLLRELIQEQRAVLRFLSAYLLQVLEKQPARATPDIK